MAFDHALTEALRSVVRGAYAGEYALTLRGSKGSVRRTVLVGRLDDVPALDAQRHAILRALIGEDRE